MIQKVQVALVVRGYDPGPVDGKLGQKTKVALGRFQAANGLPISGTMDLETLRRLGGEVVMPSIQGQPDVSAQAAIVDDDVTEPNWLRQPNGDVFSRYYPDRAQRMEVSGRVTMRCRVTESGELTQCQIASETPAGYGFGDAALRLVPYFRLNPLDLDGRAVAGRMITVPVAFQGP